jgi:hypothetical protein
VNATERVAIDCAGRGVYTFCMRLAMLVMSACLVLSCVGEPPVSSGGGADMKKRVFLTGEHNGDLNGKPNEFCGLEAREEKKKWRAFIATGTTPASASLTGLNGPYYQYGSEQPLVTLTNGDIPMEAIRNLKPDRDAEGKAVMTVNIWVGNLLGSLKPAGETRCGEWRFGGPAATGYTWNTTSGNIDTNLICETPFARVLCFEE